MLLNLLFTFGGFALLLWGADRFSAGAAASANLLGVPPLLIGLTVVGFATSAPEIMVSVSAASNGLTGMAVGNAIGSNIANIGLVLGVTALLKPISGELSTSLRNELPILVLLTPVAILLFLDNRLDRFEGVILLTGLVIFITWMAWLGLRLSSQPDHFSAEITEEIPQHLTMGMACLWIGIGFITLMAGAQLLVTGAENLARAFGVSDLIIGLTIVAIGTSLPEFMVSVVSALKGETGIAIGNIIGSNVFNLLAVVGASGLIGPGALDGSILNFHYPVMIAFTVPLLLIAYNPFGKEGLGRGMGFILVTAFFAYHTVLLTGAL